LILGLGALWASPALAQLCPRPGEAPKVTVTAKPGTLRLDRSLGDKALTALVQKLERTLRAMEAQRRRKNTRIDTPESYRAIREKCGNW
jgi:hypothetical protein